MRDFHLPGRSAVHAANGICATSHPLAAKAAVQVLEEGGNAVDAAIAGAVLLGLCEPQMTGIGGDCFVLMTDAGSDEVLALNGSGRAPAGLRIEDFGAEIPSTGALPVTLPGAVDAFCTLAERHGSMGLDRLLAPAIRYAEEGVPVAPRVAFDWKIAERRLNGPGVRHYLYDGAAPEVGRVFRAPGQAEVLRRIAAQGRAAFYEGEVAEDMVATLRAHGGRQTLEDFAAVRCDWTDPISADYGGLEVVEHPPNGQGATALLLLKMLAHFDVAGMDPLGAERIHLEAEATKLAYDARNRFIADPDHVTRLAHMTSDETAAELAALIDPRRVMPAGAPAAGQVHKDTVYICVVDRDRRCVSLIYSIFSSFGSGLASEKFGILFQNRGCGFTLQPGHPNLAGPGKRPMHTIIPGMLRQGGRALGPFGVMGGGYQPAGHARLVSNLTDFGMDLQQAIDAPRAFQRGPVLELERGYPEEVRNELAAMGHEVAVPQVPLGGAQCILVTEAGDLVGGSDPRKDGIALGY